MSTKLYFYWDEENQAVQGPGKLPVLAVLLKQNAITGDTPICQKDTEDWFPLRDLPEYGMLPELAPEGARIVMPGEETDEERDNREARRNFLAKAVVALGIGLIGSAVVMALAALDPGMATILMAVAFGLMTLGAAMTLVNALDEGYLWMLGIAFVPFLDIAYALMNPKVTNWVLLRYISYFLLLGVAIAGVAGAAIRASLEQSGGL
ncbi:MAG: hypothetical protein AAGK14_01860 [Verrucomicrobiota bacterium]